MTDSLRNQSDRLSLISLTATAAVASVHHVYRLGLGILLPAVIITVLPYLLMRRYRSSGSRVALWSFAGLTVLVALWFGFVDGFLDHVMKALGLQHTTLLPGGEAPVVPTAFSLWSPEAGDLFYEGTGILEFPLSVVALYYCHRLLHARRIARTVTPRAAASAPARVM